VLNANNISVRKRLGSRRVQYPARFAENTIMARKVESFEIDHLTMPAPQVRPAGVQVGPKGDKLSKFDLRFLKPNTDAMPTATIHTLEHLLATYMREHLEGIIDLSPMGCRTGFYLTVWGEVSADSVREALVHSLKKVVTTQWIDVPGTTAKECGNYRDHSLFGAQEYATVVLKGLTGQ
jgi:S-ribosylhomocysteine lyase